MNPRESDFCNHTMNAPTFVVTIRQDRIFYARFSRNTVLVVVPDFDDCE
jgi:hypothetical protein